MHYFKELKTQFSRERLEETTWENRFYIKDLWFLEKFIRNKGPGNSGEGMIYCALREKYPVEYRAIKKELTWGIITSQAKFNQLIQELELKKLLNKTRKLTAQLEEEKNNLACWIEAGGR